MKKAILFIACFAVLVLTLSAYTDRATAPVVGYCSPALSLTAADSSTTTLDAMKGKYVLVTFWSSSDAASRLRCNRYDTLCDGNDRLVHIAVNFDRNETLFEEVVRRDNLSRSSQYHVEGQQAHVIMKLYHLDRGLHSFLIDPSGVIRSIDPDDAQARDLMPELI